MDSLDRLKKINRSFLFKLTGRTSLFLFLLSTFLIVLYVSGSYQDFLDSTLNFVLTSCSATILGLFVFSAVFHSSGDKALFFFLYRKENHTGFIFLYIYFRVFFPREFFFLQEQFQLLQKEFKFLPRNGTEQKSKKILFLQKV